ncbi:hypothetical protein Vretimale_11744 [Volvox reticuliferus]|nr:hypothetical protein Vretifemale_20247 [Volvox reticuliferus]GIM07671.1 hypothetical protein Vretimale_11744 [Volvox reticuliferus]
MGGESLKRRQVNVFHWNGKLVPDHSDTGIKPAYRHLQSTQLPTAYEGLGSWRAATIRGYDPSTCRFEIKYHDEPKRSQAHIWLPLAVLHFARNPPATEAAIRSSPDTASQPSTSPFTTQSCDTGGNVTPPLLRPLLPTPPLPLAIQTQSCGFGHPLPTPVLAAPLPVQLAAVVTVQAAPPPLQDKASAPLLGSLQSIPTAPASPQASRQDSPQHGFPNHDWSARVYGGEASSQHYLAMNAEEAPVKLPLHGLRQQLDFFTSSTQHCGAVADGVVAGGVGAGSAGGVPAAPAVAPPRGFMESRVRSLVALSANSDSGSSSSSSVAAGGDISGGAGGDGCSDCTIGCGRGDCATPNSSKRGEPADVLGVTREGAQPGARWPPLPQATAATLATLPFLPPAFSVCGGYWAPQLGLPTAANALGTNNAVAVGSGSADAATTTLPATGCSATQAAAPGTGDDAGDDLAALYAELCSEEVIPTDQVLPLRNTTATTLAAAAIATAHPTTGTPGFSPSDQQLQVANNDDACRASSSPPSAAAAAAFMKPGPPPCGADGCAAIHPILRGELLERQRQALMMLAHSSAAVFAQTHEQALLPTCLPQQQQQQPLQPTVACAKRPRPDDPTGGLTAPAAVAMNPYGTLALCGFGAATERQSSGAVMLPPTPQEWDDSLRGLLPTGFWDGMLVGGWDGLSATAYDTAKRVHLACRPQT